MIKEKLEWMNENDVCRIEGGYGSKRYVLTHIDELYSLEINGKEIAYSYDLDDFLHKIL